MQSVHGMLQQKRGMAAPCAGLSCTEKTRQHSSARPSTPYPTWRSHRKRSERPATVTTKSCLWFRCRHAERRVPSGACQVDVEVTRARTAVRDAHAAKIDLRKALKKASLKHTLACGATKSDQSSSPSVARTCSATRLNSPLQRYCACLRAILDSLTGWAGWYARRP